MRRSQASPGQPTRRSQAAPTALGALRGAQPAARSPRLGARQGRRGSKGGGKSSLDSVSDVDRNPVQDIFSCLKLLLNQDKFLPVRFFYASLQNHFFGVFSFFAV